MTRAQALVVAAPSEVAKAADTEAPVVARVVAMAVDMAAKVAVKVAAVDHGVERTRLQAVATVGVGATHQVHLLPQLAAFQSLQLAVRSRSLPAAISLRAQQVVRLATDGVIRRLPHPATFPSLPPAEKYQSRPQAASRAIGETCPASPVSLPPHPSQTSLRLGRM